MSGTGWGGGLRPTPRTPFHSYGNSRRTLPFASDAEPVSSCARPSTIPLGRASEVATSMVPRVRVAMTGEAPSHPTTRIPVLVGERPEHQARRAPELVSRVLSEANGSVAHRRSHGWRGIPKMRSVLGVGRGARSSSVRRSISNSCSAGGHEWMVVELSRLYQ